MSLKDSARLSEEVKVVSMTNDDYSDDRMTDLTFRARYRRMAEGPFLRKHHALMGASSILSPGTVRQFGASISTRGRVSSEITPRTVVFESPAQPRRRRDVDRLRLRTELFRATEAGERR